MSEAARASSTTCPVAPLVEELRDVLRKREYFELRDRALFDALERRVSEIEAAATVLQPTSPIGLAYCAMLAMADIDCALSSGSALSQEATTFLRRAMFINRTMAWSCVDPFDPIVAFYLGNDLVRLVA